MKKSLMLYYDLDAVLKMLTDEEAGALIKAVFDYEIRGERAAFDDRMMASTFMRIADSLDRNKEKYEEVSQRKREAALIRWQKMSKNDESRSS